ncbi:MAG: hypothetical protein R2695_05385 [Acidimicrobiales bacterium]
MVRLDHSAIFLMFATTATPIAMLALDPPVATWLLSVAWFGGRRRDRRGWIPVHPPAGVMNGYLVFRVVDGRVHPVDGDRVVGHGDRASPGWRSGLHHRGDRRRREVARSVDRRLRLPRDLARVRGARRAAHGALVLSLLR